MELAALPVGARLPFDVSRYAAEPDKPILLCLISLYCMSCIDLLPDLGEYDKQLPANFVLICNGEEKEISAIREHFGFTFPTIRKSEEDILNQLHVRQTSGGRLNEDEKMDCGRADADRAADGLLLGQ
jgi:hypothetical protein